MFVKDKRFYRFASRIRTCDLVVTNPTFSLSAITTCDDDYLHLCRYCMISRRVKTSSNYQIEVSFVSFEWMVLDHCRLVIMMAAILMMSLVGGISLPLECRSLFCLFELSLMLRTHAVLFPPAFIKSKRLRIFCGCWSHVTLLLST